MIELSKQDLKIQDFIDIVFYNKNIEISEYVKELVEKNYNFLKTFSKNKLIYGINTGLGPMSQFKIDDNDQVSLQYNLIRSHSSGLGNVLSEIDIMSAMLARINTLSKGYSGVNITVINLLKDLINYKIYPLIYSHGGVGASGDLVQLAHIALCLIGEGKVIYKSEIRNTKEVFEELKLKPIEVKLREGLALINGTSVMTGIGINNIIFSKKLLEWSIWFSSVLNEIVESYDDHFSNELNSVKKHYGQNFIAEKVRNIIQDSLLIKKRSKDLYDKIVSEKEIEKKVQEYYSLRCIPQILGPIYDQINNTEKILIDEVNSVNDNPIVDLKNENVLHGGNFHGDYISFEMDKLKIAITKLSMLSERQLNFLMNNKINSLLPPFVNTGILGLNLGMQGAQFTATSTTAENQMLSNPMYVHSIPNNNDNQDIVSMGTNSALITRKVIDNTFEVLAIECLSILQAIDYLEIEKKLSSKSQKIFNELRTIVPFFKNDDIMHDKLEKIRIYLKANNLNII